MTVLLAHDRFAEYLLKKLSPEEILAFQIPEPEQEYVRDLIERNNAGTLTAEESEQVQQILQFERMMMVMKAKAMALLKKS